jgi:hypothetical protein
VGTGSILVVASVFRYCGPKLQTLGAKMNDAPPTTYYTGLGMFLPEDYSDIFSFFQKLHKP